MLKNEKPANRNEHQNRKTDQKIAKTSKPKIPMSPSFIDRPSNLIARAQTLSSYKHHNTIKVLIGISSQGKITFITKAWGGRTSDKFLTENCGFLDKF